MTTRTENIVLETFTLLSHLSGVQNGMTLGEITKAMPYITKGQAGRIVSYLENMGWIYRELLPHGRTGKNVFKMTEGAAIFCADIARTYTETRDRS